MKELVLVRHTNAEDPDFGLSDFNRQLTEKGIKKAEKISGMCMSFANRKKIKMISSPAIRAIDTAKIFAKTLGYKNECIVTEPFLYQDYSKEELLQFISSFPEKSIWVFGHNPTLCDIANELTTRSFESFPKCMVVAIKLKDENTGKGNVEFILNPKNI